MKSMRHNTLSRILRTLLFTTTAALILTSCEEKEEGMDVEVSLTTYLMALNNNESYYEFSGTLDEDVTTSCGDASPITGGSETGTSTARTENAGSGHITVSETSTDSDDYRIIMYYQFETGKTDFSANFPTGYATLYAKWEYNRLKREFTLTPLTQTTTTCPTLDFIKCNGTAGVSPECETVDGVNCGGTNAFSFTSVNEVNGELASNGYSPDLTFQAESGTVNWSEGFALNSNNSEVTRADLTFKMTSSDGSHLKADVYCENNVY